MVGVISRVIFICGALASAQRCQNSFYNTLVTVSGSVPPTSLRVTGCINSKSLKSQNSTGSTIEIKNQVIAALNWGAVSDIEVEELSIINNQIEGITAGAFHNLPKLEELYLNNNQLISLEPYSFEDLPYLRGIYLGENNISTIFANTFVTLFRLHTLDLHSNKLVAFNGMWFSSAPNLKWLDLGDNKIKLIKNDTFRSLENLEVASFLGNSMSLIEPDAFSGLGRLQDLDFNFNELSSFDVRLPPKIRRLEIASNMITYIPVSVFDVVRNSLKTIEITGNPMQCSCLENLVSWAAKYLVDLKWKCETLPFHCIYPLSGDTECAVRDASEFNATYMDIIRLICTHGDGLRVPMYPNESVALADLIRVGYNIS